MNKRLGTCCKFMNGLRSIRSMPRTPNQIDGSLGRILRIAKKFDDKAVLRLALDPPNFCQVDDSCLECFATAKSIGTALENGTHPGLLHIGLTWERFWARAQKRLKAPIMQLQRCFAWCAASKYPSKADRNLASQFQRTSFLVA